MKGYVEDYCRKKGVTEVNMKEVFSSKPDIRKLYPNPIYFAFENHMGPVYSVNFNPYLHNIFLSCSYDGSIRIYDLL